MKCQVQGCIAEAKHKLRMPKVQVCEEHFQRNRKARQRMANIRAYFKRRTGKYERYQGIRYGKYYYLDARKKKDVPLTYHQDGSA